jgi:hypothetical protein
MKRFLTAWLFILACASAQVITAQSTDQNLPTPVLSSEINGRISALDLGDPRTTRHFYAFAGNPGDLLITVDSRNLDGDVDIFTAITYRPLMKTTVYASSQSPSIAKGIYLRAHQLLILRVEARTPNDDPGTYHIRFGGTFEPFSGGIPVAENTETPDTTNVKGSPNRLSSVGATIPRPTVEITQPAEARTSPSPEKTEEKSPEKTADTAEAKPDIEKPAAKTTTARTSTARSPRRSTRTTPSRRQPPPKKTEPANKSDTDATSVESKTDATKVQPTDAAKNQSTPEEKPSEKSAETPPSEKKNAQEAAAQPAGARLIIEEKDGTRIERPMSTVRRVVVEGATIMVVLKTGRIERVPMIDVARMAIEPQ